MNRSISQVLRDTDQLLLLDGPTGTRLAEHGFPVDSHPGWSARALIQAPELVERIHQEYVAAGACLLTANTFRAHEQNLRGWWKQGRSGEMVDLAVGLARKAAGKDAWVLGSVAPVGDCYTVDEITPVEILQEQHCLMAKNLHEAGVDAALLETHVSLRELLIASEALYSMKIPILASMMTPDGLHLLDGTLLSHAVQQLTKFAPLAVGVNCLPVELVASSLQQLKQEMSTPLLVYANSSCLTESGSWQPTLGDNVVQHTELAREWLRTGVRILGGCCGTGPELIRSFSDAFVRPSR